MPSKLAFDDFAAQVRSAGLTPKPCAWNHWQILGGVRPVNMHMDANGCLSVVYVNGSEKGIRGADATLETALRAAIDGEQPAQAFVRRKNAGFSMRKKRWLFSRDDRCRWCRAKLTLDIATIDHMVPLYQGGSNRDDNLCLACEPCNTERANKAVRPKVTKLMAVDAVFSEMAE